MKKFCVVLKSGVEKVISIEDNEEAKFHEYIARAIEDDVDAMSTELRPGWFVIRVTEIAMIIAL